MSSSSYGQRISYLRESHKLTQTELARRLGITRASLSHYETGRRVPDFDTLAKMADLFGVSVDYIIGRTEQPVASPEIREFDKHLELSDEQILKKYTFTIDGRELSPEEARRFIAFIRAERSMQ